MFDQLIQLAPTLDLLKNLGPLPDAAASSARVAAISAAARKPSTKAAEAMARAESESAASRPTSPAWVAASTGPSNGQGVGDGDAEGEAQHGDAEEHADEAQRVEQSRPDSEAVGGQGVQRGTGERGPITPPPGGPLLGFAADLPVRVAAVRSQLSLDQVGSLICPPRPVKAAPLSGVGVILAATMDPARLPAGVRAGLGAADQRRLPSRTDRKAPGIALTEPTGLTRATIALTTWRLLDERDAVVTGRVSGTNP